MEKNSPDHLLAEKALENPEVFGEIIERYENPLLRYILRISEFSSAEAEDILQEVFLKAWRNLNDFDTSLQLSSWLYRIAHNETISTFRKWESRGGKQREDFEPELFENLSSDEDIKKEVDQKMTAEKVQEILSLLREKDRSILVLFYLEEKSYEEISDILKIPPGTVATNLYRAKKAFKTSAKNSFEKS